MLLRIRVTVRVLVIGRRERHEMLGFCVEVVHATTHLYDYSNPKPQPKNYVPQLWPEVLMWHFFGVWNSIKPQYVHWGCNALSSSLNTLSGTGAIF